MKNKRFLQPSHPLLTALLLLVFAVAVLAGSALAASGNLTRNASFEKDSNGDGLPNKWDFLPADLTPKDKRVCTQSYAGKCSFKMVGTGTLKQVSQIISTPGLAGEEFDLSFWAKGKLITAGEAKVCLGFTFTGGTGSGNSSCFPVASGTSPWSLYQLSFSADQDFISYDILLFIDAGSGKVWFDKVTLLPSP